MILEIVGNNLLKLAHLPPFHLKYHVFLWQAQLAVEGLQECLKELLRFHCLPVSSLQVAKFVVEQLPFDRLYFYGDNRPVHVSVNTETSSQIVIMKKMKTRVVPQRMTVEAFLSI
jgi:hypothetical protein